MCSSDLLRNKTTHAKKHALFLKKKTSKTFETDRKNRTLQKHPYDSPLSHTSRLPGCSHHFLSGAQHSHLAEAHMEGRALQGAIGLVHHDDVDAAGQGGGVQAPVQLLHLHKHLTRQLTHIVHGLTGLKENREGESRRY